jgi:hypothetical protein
MLVMYRNYLIFCTSLYESSLYTYFSIACTETAKNSFSSVSYSEEEMAYPLFIQFSTLHFVLFIGH